VTRVVELGAGKVLTGLTRRILGDVVAKPVSTPADVLALAGELRGEGAAEARADV
jgi:hypothetical protein